MYISISTPISFILFYSNLTIRVLLIPTFTVHFTVIYLIVIVVTLAVTMTLDPNHNHNHNPKP